MLTGCQKPKHDVMFADGTVCGQSNHLSASTVTGWLERMKKGKTCRLCQLNSNKGLLTLRV